MPLPQRSHSLSGGTALSHPPGGPHLQAQLQRNAQQGGIWWCAGWGGRLAGILCQFEEQGWRVDILLDGAQYCMQPLGVS